MEHYAGLDISLKLTAVCVIDERSRVVAEGKIPSEPDTIAAFLQPFAETLTVAELEAGLLGAGARARVTGGGDAPDARRT
jgi:transposase